MTIRTVVFDVYKTLLKVSPPPKDAAERWDFLWQDMLADPPRLSLEAFAAATEAVVAREHAAARAGGIAYPEIYWPAVAREVLMELAHLSEAEQQDFLFRHVRILREVEMTPEAGRVLKALKGAGLPLGIVSNAQPYTLREFDLALARVDLGFQVFESQLCFWSFQAGFGKPDPHVFRMINARLLAMGVHPGEVLMVGDRLDNDIEPARRQGWHAWHLAPEPAIETGGDWAALEGWLRREKVI